MEKAHQQQSPMIGRDDDVVDRSADRGGGEHDTSTSTPTPTTIRAAATSTPTTTQSPATMEGASSNSLLDEQLDEQEEKSSGPSNEYVLNIAFLSFLFFMLIQIFFALLANSQAMLADSMAMSVDAFTYLFNLVAERLKRRPLNADDSIPVAVRRLQHERTRLYLELFPPLISVVTLIVVSLYVLKDAVDTVVAYYAPNDGGDNSDGAEGDGDGEGSTNANIMLLFSFLNLILDIVNVSFFAKVKSFGFFVLHQCCFCSGGGGANKTGEPRGQATTAGEGSKRTHEKTISAPPSEKTRLLAEVPNAQVEEEKEEEESSCDQTSYDSMESGGSRSGGPGSGSGMVPFNIAADGEEKSENDDDDDDEEEGRLNLNMCSAYTHVMADTMRSVAVLIAAGLAMAVDDITPEMADAVSAIVVSFIIALSLGPLVTGLVRTWGQLRELGKRAAAAAVAAAEAVAEAATEEEEQQETRVAASSVIMMV